MLCEDPISQLVVHIPEEDRCIDILELIELDKLLQFHSHTLSLYGALCYQGTSIIFSDWLSFNLSFFAQATIELLT